MALIIFVDFVCPRLYSIQKRDPHVHRYVKETNPLMMLIDESSSACHILHRSIALRQAPPNPHLFFVDLRLKSRIH